MLLAQSSHIWDGGCSLIFSWKGCCNIDKEPYHDVRLWTWTCRLLRIHRRAPCRSDCACVTVYMCVVSVHLVLGLQQHCFFLFVFFSFLGRFEELFIAACWSSEHVLRLLPPSRSSHLISPPGFMMPLDSPSSSHTFLPLIPAFSSHLLFCHSVLILCFLSSFPPCFRHDHLPSASLWISACELLMVARWQWLGATLGIAALTEDNRHLDGTENEMRWYDSRQTDRQGLLWFSLALCVCKTTCFQI